MKEIKIKVVHGNAFEYKADTLVLKYAQASYGLDKDIINEFRTRGLELLDEKLPKIGDYYYIKSKNVTNTDNIIFIGVPYLKEFGYKGIRVFGKKAMTTLSTLNSQIKSVIFTIHGPGYGLDEIECFKSQIAGIVDSISTAKYPGKLEEIVFIEKSKGRAIRLDDVLKRLFPNNIIPNFKSEDHKQLDNDSLEILRSAGYSSESKKRAFVAMPFAEEFDDCFHYGIQGAANASGLLCERADIESFTGDVMEWIKKRISTSNLVIADLTTANPNVYLEVGFAWGLGKQTILLIKNTQELKFDTRSQKCVVYKNIKDLEAKLTKELNNLMKTS